MSNLNPEKALIFRIVHGDCVPWILNHGLHCRSSARQDPNYVNIGNVSLIDKRARKEVPISPGGTLNDYVPFYFTPFSIMMYNIHTGYGGITRRRNDEIVIFVSSLHKLRELGVPFVFTDQHAYAAGTDYFSDLTRLDRIDWELLRSRNFKTDDTDPGKQLRYQPEALVYRHVPIEALIGLVCHDDTVLQRLAPLLAANKVELSLKAIPGWYF